MPKTMSVDVMYQPYTSGFGYQRNNDISFQVTIAIIVFYCFNCFVGFFLESGSNSFRIGTFLYYYSLGRDENNAYPKFIPLY